MKVRSFVETYQDIPVADRKSGIAQLRRTADLETVLRMATGEKARAATRVLADCGGRIKGFVTSHISKVLPLLQADDPKVRMHAAQIVGNTCADEHVYDLTEALDNEKTMFVYPAFLLAIGSAKNSEAQKYLESYTIRSDIDKHIFEEKSALSKALANFVHREKPVLRILPTDVIVCSTPNANVTLDAFTEIGMKPKKFGKFVAVSGLDRFSEIYRTRAFGTAYIYLGSCPVKDLPDFLVSRENAIIQRTHVTGYRLEVKSVSHEVRLDIIQQCVAKMQRLQNSPSSYSIEIMLEINEGKAQVFLNPLVDQRFQYRKKALPASINPGVAACVISYASPYFSADARVLDNFCGAGTLLYERGFYPHHTLTGVDISLGAVEAAQENSRYAHVHPQFHYIDALKFTAKEYDEVICNMPFGMRVGSHGSNERLYARYFSILPDILAPKGIAVLYTHEKRLTEQLIASSGRFEILKRTTFDAGGLYPAVFILRKSQG